MVYFSKKLVRVEFGRKSSSEIYIPGSVTGLNFINQMLIADQIDWANCGIMVKVIFFSRIEDKRRGRGNKGRRLRWFYIAIEPQSF